MMITTYVLLLDITFGAWMDTLHGFQYSQIEYHKKSAFSTFKEINFAKLLGVLLLTVLIDIQHSNINHSYYH